MPDWPERVRVMQANWIGRSEGVRLGFPHDIGEGGVLWAFTTRADTVMGATFCAVAAEHPLAEFAAQDNAALAAFIEECKRGPALEAELATQEKKGMPTGLHVRHPISGEPVPVWVGNYVLMSYGDGAVMGVPAHDERDFAFAKKYRLPIKQVIEWQGQSYSLAAWQPWYSDHGRCISSGPYDGLDYQAAVDTVARDLQAKGLGEKRTTWRLRDWGISRQRYWGCPIPIIHCRGCGAVPVPDEQLPVILPTDLVPDGSGNPLLKDERFLNVKCPKCGAPARRETDTMDTFVDSSWYFLRFACADNNQAMLDYRVQYWLPVDQYIGGIEHAILHLLYARFWTRFLKDMGAVSFKEPFARLFTQGMVLNEVFFRKSDSGRIQYFNPADVTVTTAKSGKGSVAVLKSDGKEVESGGVVTMSKSKNNGVDPQMLVDEFGADTARLFIMFAAPPEQTLEWSDEGVQGAFRFIKRLWKAVHEHVSRGPAAPLDKAALTEAQRALRRQSHQTLAKVTDDIGRRRTFNTAIAAVMELLNAVAKLPQARHAGPRCRAGGSGDCRPDPVSDHPARHACALVRVGLRHCADRRALAATRCCGLAVGHRADGRPGERQVASPHYGCCGLRPIRDSSSGPGRPPCSKIRRDLGDSQGDHRAGQAREHRGVMPRGQRAICRFDEHVRAVRVRFPPGRQ